MLTKIDTFISFIIYIYFSHKPDLKELVGV